MEKIFSTVDMRNVEVGIHGYRREVGYIFAFEKTLPDIIVVYVSFNHSFQQRLCSGEVRST